MNQDAARIATCSEFQAAMPLILADNRESLRDNRESLRDTVLRWNKPVLTPRINSGWAARNATVACSLSPLTMARSTLRRKVRMRLSLAPLTAVRRLIWRMRFFAES